MGTAKITLSKLFRQNEIDKRIYGSFVEHMGSTIYNGIFEPDHPEADENGFRRDVLDLVKDLDLPVIRYPGGNFACSYNWEDTVGPVSERPVRIDLAWRQIEPNTFGLPEFMKWMELVGSEPIMALNLGTRGVQDAANLIEYCNFEGGTYYSDLRKKHGYKPFNIKLWCLGNELDGPWNIGAKRASEYGWLANEAAKAMRRVDKDIETILVGSSAPTMSTYPEWDRQVLMDAYNETDYIALHLYLSPTDDLGSYLASNEIMDRQIRTVKAACDYVKGALRSNKTINLSFDEYNVLHPNESKFVPYSVGSPIDMAHYDMKNTLLFGSTVMTLLRHSDRVKIACQSLLVNTGPLILAEKGGKAYANSLYYLMRCYSKHGRGWVMIQNDDGPTYETEQYGTQKVVDSISIYNDEKGELTVFAVNRSSEGQEIELKLHDFTSAEPVEHVFMHNPDLEITNTLDNMCALNPQSANDIKIDGNAVSCPLLPYSWNMIRIKC